MAEENESILKTLGDIQSLRELLKTEMSVGEPEEGKVTAEIRVYNDAPLSSGGSEVVFVGVGLRIIDGRESTSRKLASKVKVLEKSDQIEERQKYNKGEWVTGRARFPAYTADEQSHGHILFPGEGLVFEVDISEDQLPYLDIRVEGSVSRRHLLHLSKPMEALRKWSQPRVVQTFSDLDKIDLYKPLVSLIDAIPEFSPQTTLTDINAFRKEIEKAINHVKEVMPELNQVYQSVPNQELADLVRSGVVTKEEAMMKSNNPGKLNKLLL